MIDKEKIIIQLAKEEDIAYIMYLENDDYNKQFIWSGTYDEHLNELVDDNYLLLIIKEKLTKKNIGFILCYIDFENDVLEIRRIGIEDKNKGYGKESLGAIIEYSFEKLNINRIWLDVYTDNHVGIKLYETLGMTLDAVFRESYKSERGFLDQIIYSILKDEYKSRLI